MRCKIYLPFPHFWKFYCDFTRFGREQKSLFQKDLTWMAKFLMKQIQISGIFLLYPFIDAERASYISCTSYLLILFSEFYSLCWTYSSNTCILCFYISQLTMSTNCAKYITTDSFHSVVDPVSVLVISLLCWKLPLLSRSFFST